jgi:hypothetical protein
MSGSEEKKPYRSEYWRAWRQRKAAEGRCSHCGRERGPADDGYRTCGKCRATLRELNRRRYADQREKNPPAGSKGDPRASFRSGAYRLDNARIVRFKMDGELARSLGILRMGFVESGLWEPHSRSIFWRALLKLPLRLGAEARVRPRPRIGRDEWVLARPADFRIDGECDGVLSRYRARTRRKQAEAVRDILYWSAEHLIASHNGTLKPRDARPFHPDDFYKAVARPKPRPSERPRHHTPTPRVFPGILR